MPGDIQIDKLVLYLISVFVTFRSNIPTNHLDPKKDKDSDILFKSTARLYLFLLLKWGLIAYGTLQQLAPCIFQDSIPDLLANLIKDTRFLYTPLSTNEIVLFIITIGGAIFRIWCFYTLGQFFTFQVGIRKNHSLIGTGPYRYLVHPSYTGTIFNTIGFLVLSQLSPWIIVPYSVGFLMFIKKRIGNEEQMLASHFKKDWAEHTAKRWRLFPFIF
jgi:protein-S-isoprenylcysteine O-methyltransferase Ste14